MPDYQYPFDQFAHRQAHPIEDIPVLRLEIEEIVERLLDLEKRTHPQNPSPDDKELDSISALVWAGKLVEKLAGWAIYHRAGMILNGTTVFPWPESDQDAASQANDHRHEATGSAYLQTNESSAPQENRRIIAEIATRTALLPAALRHEFSEAIRAVDFGETRPLFLPPKGQHKNSFGKWQLRLRAIEHVYFLWGSGETKTKEDAVRQVAKAFGVSADTVDSWDRGPFGLLHHFGEPVTKVAQDAARKSGTRFQHLQMQLHKSDSDEEDIKVLHMTYGPERLSLNGQRFKMVDRNGAK